MDTKYDQQDVFQLLKLTNYVINSWAGLVEISPITDIKEIIGDKEALHLISGQMSKYEINSQFNASANYDSSIQELQKLTIKIKETMK